MSPLLVLLLLGCAGGAVGVSAEGRQLAPSFVLVQQVEGKARLGYGCLPRTHYVTLTSTRVVPSTVYATSIHHIPTQLVQNVTEWQLQTSTVVVTHTLTSYPHPRVITTTQALTATRYVTQVQYLTETEYVTSTESWPITDTVVATKRVTKTRPVVTYDTHTITTTSTHHQRDTRVVTTSLYQYVTVTKQVPIYVTRTHTSYYKVYDTKTVTVTEDEYVTNTSLLIQTRTFTRCSSTPTMTYLG
ncbi:uncharacterized protein [Panulirus ornatus]|uniref:uncharacterized protein n=1 Tax=Panulirus ornatus TaxID=150431 RepID=UPI003A8793FE